MWREPRLDDRYYRDDITAVFVGRQWFYAFIESRMELHRLAWFDDTHDVARVQRRPPDAQALTQVFYNKKNSRRFESWRPAYKPPGHQGHWTGRSDVVPALVNPFTLSLPSLTQLYNRLSDIPVERPFTQLHTAQRRAIPLLEKSDWVLVTHVPDGVTAMSISAMLHLIPRHSLPANAKSHPRESRLDVGAHIRVLAQECPHKPGSARARAWNLAMRTGYKVAQFIAHCGLPRQQARDYIIHAAEAGHIAFY